MKNLLWFSLLVLAGCGGANTTKPQIEEVGAPFVVDFSQLDVGEKDCINLSQIADSISYIRLSNEVLLGAVNYVTPIDDKELMIFANHLVYRYDLATKSYKKIFNSGRGPNEAVCYSRPMLNRAKRSVAVRDNVSLFSKVYDFEGQIIDKYEKQVQDDEGHAADRYTVAFWGNKELVTQKRNDHRSGTPFNPYGTDLFVVRDLDRDTIIYRYKNPTSDFRFKVTTDRFRLSEVPVDVFAGQIKDRSWFAVRSIDTIYTTTDFTEVTPKYILKPFAGSLDFQTTLTMMNGALDKALIGSYLQAEVTLSDRYLVMSYELSRRIYVVYDNVTDKVLGFTQPIKNDLDATVDLDMIDLFHSGSCDQNKFYIPVDAYKLKEGKSAARFSDLTDDSNPVVMVIHLKQ